MSHRWSCIHHAKMVQERTIFNSLAAKQARLTSSGETVRAAGCATPSSSKHAPQSKPWTYDDVIQCEPEVRGALILPLGVETTGCTSWCLDCININHLRVRTPAISGYFRSNTSTTSGSVCWRGLCAGVAKPMCVLSPVRCRRRWGRKRNLSFTYPIRSGATYMTPFHDDGLG